MDAYVKRPNDVLLVQFDVRDFVAEQVAAGAVAAEILFNLRQEAGVTVTSTMSTPGLVDCTVTGGVIYCAGKFGKALQVAGATTNLFTDPSCEYDANLTQWTDYTASGTFTSVRSTEVVPLYGTYTGKLVCSSSAAALFYQSLSPSAGSCVISAYVRKADKSAVTVSDCQIYFGADKTTTYTAIGDGWYRLVWTGTASGSSTQTGLRVQKSKTLYVDGLMCEQARSVQGPFADGTLGDGHAWTGTAYTSTSTRTAAA
jgi:hypothetical protein